MPRAPRGAGMREVGERSRLVNKQEQSQDPASLLPRLSGLLTRGAPEAPPGAAGEPVIVFGLHRDELQMIFQGLISQHICSI